MIDMKTRAVRSRGWTLAMGWAAAFLIQVAPLAAQEGAPPGTPSRGTDADSVKQSHQPFFVPMDAVYAAGVVAGTLALAPLDLKVADAFQNPERQGNRFLRETATGFRVLGNPGVIIVSGGLYVTGKLADRPNMADVGLHVGESIAATGLITDILKSLVGRTRPEEDPDHPHKFHLGGGWRDDPHESFPSGHTSAAFAAAASISTELGRLYPDTRVWVRPILYGSAGLVGLSRIYNNKHWATDVLGGAAIGTFTAWKVVGYNHTHPGNRVDRFFLGEPTVVMTPNSIMLAWRF
jgi:membrane-associated phospholipid phosphatase